MDGGGVTVVEWAERLELWCRRARCACVTGVGESRARSDRRPADLKPLAEVWEW